MKTTPNLIFTFGLRLSLALCFALFLTPGAWAGPWKKSPIPSGEYTVVGTTVACSGTNYVYSVQGYPTTGFDWRIIGSGTIIGPASGVSVTVAWTGSGGTVVAERNEEYCEIISDEPPYQVCTDIVECYPDDAPPFQICYVVGQTCETIDPPPVIQCTPYVAGGSLAVSVVGFTTYTVTGGGSLCAGNSATVGLSGSQSGYSYQLYLNGGYVNAQTGNGGALGWGGLTSSGTYTVVATANGCSQNMSGSTTVTINPLPIQYSVAGGGPFCGSASATITLSGSQGGVNYQLLKDGSNIGSAIAGTGGGLSWPGQTLAGAYMVIATNASTGCGQAMSGLTNVVINPLPTLFTVGGTAVICAGGSTTITLSGSQSGVNYQLRKDGVNTGSAVAGTGSALNFAGQTVAGVYTVVATNATTSCAQTMTSSVTLVVNPLPTLFAVSGGGSFCASATVSLSGSQSGVNYQLRKDGVNTGSAIGGTGGALSWAGQTAAGNYTVIATNASTGCVQTMSGSASVVINPPPTLFIVGGTAAICAGGSTTITLNGSQSGVNYQLRRDGVNTGSAVAGTGSALNFAGQTVSGVYTVVATNATTGCTQTMTGSVTLVVNPLPTLFTVSGGGSFCTSATVSLSGSQSGVNYQLRKDGVNTGSAVAGTGSALSWAGQTASGTYTVVATHAATTCTQTMTGSEAITINPLPGLFTVGGTAVICAGGSTTITLSGSQSGVNYQLRKDGVNTGSAVAGTGSALNFAGQTVAGVYTVVATNITTLCAQTMTGSVNLVVNNSPTAFTVSGGGTFCGSGSATITLGGSQTGATYQLKKDGVDTGAPVAGTGSALNWTSQTAAGTYTVLANNGCTLTMTGSAVITIHPLPTLFTVSGSAFICAGSSIAVGLSGSQSGVNYQLRKDGVNTGTAVAGTGSTLSWPGLTAAGVYTVVATNATTSCTQTMTGSVTAAAAALPSLFTAGGTGTICSAATRTITLSGSQAGVNYQLRRDGVNTGTPLAGTGSALNFTGQNAILWWPPMPPRNVPRP